MKTIPYTLLMAGGLLGLPVLQAQEPAAEITPAPAPETPAVQAAPVAAPVPPAVPDIKRTADTPLPNRGCRMP